MSDDENKKRFTGAEILKQQREREAEANKTRIAKEAEDAMRRAQEAEQKDAAVAAQLSSSWYNTVVEASATNNVRFVVLARVQGEFPRLLAGLTQEITNAGFSYELAYLKFESNKGLILHGSKKGWLPPALPVIGQGVDYQYLLVSWGD